MRSALVGPRVLLRRLREVMSEPANAQDRLDRIVVLIANNYRGKQLEVYVDPAVEFAGEIVGGLRVRVTFQAGGGRASGSR